MAKPRLISTQEAGRMRWAGKTKAERQAHIAKMNAAREAKRLQKAGAK